MKNQVQNQGQLKELKVMIEEDVVDSFEQMSKVSGMPVAELVVVALKRYRSAHLDWDTKPFKKD